MKKHQSGYLNADISEIRYIKISIKQRLPLPGELSAKLTERLSQICRERPKPQIQFAVWKGRNEHRGKETSLAAARSVVVVSDAPPAAPSFPSCRKRRGGEKGRWVTVGYILHLNLGEALFGGYRSTR